MRLILNSKDVRWRSSSISQYLSWKNLQLHVLNEIFLLWRELVICKLWLHVIIWDPADDGSIQSCLMSCMAKNGESQVSACFWWLSREYGIHQGGW